MPQLNNYPSPYPIKRCPSCKGKPPYHHKNCSLAPEKPVMEAMRGQINHQEEETRQMVRKMGGLQEQVGKWKQIAVEMAYRHFSGIDPRDAEHKMRFWGMDPEFIALVVEELQDAGKKRRMRAE